jgi:hypothetical protein
MKPYVCVLTTVVGTVCCFLYVPRIAAVAGGSCNDLLQDPESFCEPTVSCGFPFAPCVEIGGVVGHQGSFACQDIGVTGHHCEVGTGPVTWCYKSYFCMDIDNGAGGKLCASIHYLTTNGNYVDVRACATP